MTSTIRRRLAVVALAAAVLGGCSPGRKATSPPEYVALGDSYTSGPDIPSAVGVPGCLRSDHNYPSIVAASMGARPFRDASCSGATTEHMAARQTTNNGVNPPQLDSLTASTTVVTLGIGGNDIGFGEVATRCASLLPSGSPCRHQFAAAGQDLLAERVRQAGVKVGAVIESIHRRSPKARVFVVGYPAIVPATGVSCWPQVPFTAEDAPYLTAVFVALNTALEAAVTASNLKREPTLPIDPTRYVDLSVAGAGHDACQAPGNRWVEPLIPAVPALPLHPNATGMAAIGAIVGRAVEAGR